MQSIDVELWTSLAALAMEYDTQLLHFHTSVRDQSAKLSWLGGRTYLQVSCELY